MCEKEPILYHVRKEPQETTVSAELKALIVGLDIAVLGKEESR